MRGIQHAIGIIKRSREYRRWAQKLGLKLEELLVAVSGGLVVTGQRKITPATRSVIKYRTKRDIAESAKEPA